MLLTILGLIPGALSVFQYFVGKKFDAQVAIFQAKTGADRDVAVEAVKAQSIEQQSRVAALSVIASNKLLTGLVIVFAAPLVIFEWKIVVVDIVLGMGTTDPIRGQVAEWATTIIGAIFGTTGAMAFGSMWLNRKS